jgi:ABC-2 type transport system ATP-binding protein
VAVKRLVGYLPGELSLDSNLTGGQILAYLGHLRGGVDQQQVARLVERLGLDPTRKFRHYSRGNKQKVGLVQAFMHRPRLLILDEPTSGLDPLNQVEFDRMVEEVRADGRTVFLSSHILGEAKRLCDRVAIIREGQLVRVGTIEALRDINRHKLAITFSEPVSPDEFLRLPGVERADSESGGTTLRLVVQGDLDAVVKAAARHAVLTVASHEPSLEETFLRFFETRPAPRAPRPAPDAQRHVLRDPAVATRRPGR